jgi:HD superfamily phosphodiesterase
MITSQLSLDDIVQLTLEVGEPWAVTHAVRLMKLIGQISGELVYDHQVLQFAAYMHDWGAFPKYAQKGVEHALRSRQVVEAEILPSLNLSPEQKHILLEAIELHDYRDLRPAGSNEALLLREADMLEFLGAMGMAREFARGAKDMAGSYQRIFARRAVIQNRFTLPQAQEIARIRFKRMDQYLGWLDEESFGAL